MSTSVWPLIPLVELKKREDESVENELAWLLESLQDTLASLKTGLEECYALLAPAEPGSTLVMSTSRSESLKGHITRVGTRIVKGSLHLRLKTYSPLTLALSTDEPLILTPLTSLQTLLNQALDCVDITRWTGDRYSAQFISSQLRLLESILGEAKAVLKGPPVLSPSNSAPWPITSAAAKTFSPPLPEALSLDLSITDASLALTIRVLEKVSKEPNFGERFALAIGAQRRLEHDEMDDVFLYKGENVRVKEKVRVESADPRLMSVMAKVAALEHTVGGARMGLRIVMGQEESDE